MSKKILVVDDEEVVRNYVTRALSSRGYDVVAAMNGACAAAAIEKEDFDLAICDLKMPDLRGEDVIKKLKARRPLTRVIVITGSVSDISNPILPGLTLDGFLIKPFGINDVRDMVEKVLKTGGDQEPGSFSWPFDEHSS